LHNTPKSVSAPSFSKLLQSTTLPAPKNLGDCLEEPHKKMEVIPMRSIVTYALPFILAAGVSGMMFTATLV
jgi:hypothetical protein